MSEVYFSDGCSNSYGSAYCIIEENSNERVLFILNKRINSVYMEYLGVFNTLRIAKSNSLIYTDSMQVFRELNGDGHVCECLTKLNEECLKLKRAKSIKIAWVKRDFNLAGRYLDRRLKRLKEETIKCVIHPERFVKKHKKNRYTKWKK